VKRAVVVALGAAIVIAHMPALADEDEEPPLKPLEKPTEQAKPAPPRDPTLLPELMAKKRRMRDDDLADKVEGRYFTGLPLVNSDPDTGFGFGARVYMFNNGPKPDKMFEYTPYRHRVYAQAFFTTNGYQYHTIDYDAPYFRDDPIRLRAYLAFERNIATNYFGTGGPAMDRLSFAGADRTFAKYSDYSDAIRTIRPDGTTYARNDHYIMTRPVAAASLERDFFGGIVRGLVGLSASYVKIDQWTGETVKGADDVEVRQAPTRLELDCAAGRVVCKRGFNNILKLGVAFDTRDFEPDPNSGVFVDLTSELSGRPLGSDFDWARVTFSPRAYYSPFPKLSHFVVAGRLVGSVQTEDTPISSMNGLSFTDGNRDGLGGLRTVRGYKQNRFVGRVAMLANLEVRWTFYEFNIGKRQHFGLMVVPFLDVGRVFDSLDDFEFRRFRNGQGAGLRIAWNQATIIVADYGISREGSSLYMNFNHPF